MAAWVECCYGAQTILHLGDHIILSRCGVQQGDLLGPLAFTLAIHPIVEKFKREVLGLQLNTWYLDDGTICGSASDLCADMAIVEEEELARWLQLNREKSLLNIPGGATFDQNPFPSEIPVSMSVFDHLGMPIGPTTHYEVSTFKMAKIII